MAWGAGPFPKNCISVSFKFSFSFLIYLKRERERERERERNAGGEERKGERIPSKHCTVSAEPNAGLELVNREVMT